MLQFEQANTIKNPLIKISTGSQTFAVKIMLRKSNNSMTTSANNFLIARNISKSARDSAFHVVPLKSPAHTVVVSDMHDDLVPGVSIPCHHLMPCGRLHDEEIAVLVPVFAGNSHPAFGLSCP